MFGRNPRCPYCGNTGIEVFGRSVKCKYCETVTTFAEENFTPEEYYKSRPVELDEYERGRREQYLDDLRRQIENLECGHNDSLDELRERYSHLKKTKI